MDAQKEVSQRFNKYYRQVAPALEKPKVRLYTTVVFTFLAISLFGWYAIRPTLQTIIYLQREIKDKEVLNDRMEQKIATLIEAQAAYQEAQPLLALLDEAIPDLPEALDLTLQIRNISRSRGTEYSEFAFGNIPLAEADSKLTAPPKGTDSFSASATWNGMYPQLESIIRDIHSMRRLTVVNQIRFAPEDTGARASGSATIPEIILNSSTQSYYK